MKAAHTCSLDSCVSSLKWSDVDTREECFIKFFDTVGGEEEDAVVILNMVEANRICVS
jgi:hypothetical protein